MKKITFFVFVYLLICLSSFAQNNTFYSSYSSGKEVYWYLAKPVNTGYICVGMLNNSTTVWAHTDTAGNFKTCNTFSFPVSNAISLHDNSVLVWGIRGNANATDTLTLLKISPQGNAVWAANYSVPSLAGSAIGGICELNYSHNLYISGWGQKKGKLFFGFIFETDSSGHMVKSTSLMGDTSSNKTIMSMGPLAVAGDNTCYAVANIQAWKPGNPSGGTDMIKTDSILNIKWAHAVGSYANSMIIRGNKITTAADPYLFNYGNNNWFFYTYVSNFDTSGNCLKTLIFNEIYKGSTGVTGTKDGGELVYGQRGSSSTFSVATKLDTGLNVQWSKYYAMMPWYTLSNAFSAAQTKDNGYIMACGVENSAYQPEWGFIVKTDSLGHQGCVDSNSTRNSSTQGFQPYSLDKFVLDTITINTSTPAIQSATISDTVLNYCYNGVLAINNVSAPTPKVAVFPNPSHGRFTFQITNSNQPIANSQVEIYNMLGEKVASSNSSKGGEFKTLLSGGLGWAIDLNNQPAGIYLYRILSENNTLIATGKISIQ